jgi:hypothetical protein
MAEFEVPWLHNESKRVPGMWRRVTLDAMSQLKVSDNTFTREQRQVAEDTARDLSGVGGLLAMLIGGRTCKKRDSIIWTEQLLTVAWRVQKLVSEDLYRT